MIQIYDHTKKEVVYENDANQTAVRILYNNFIGRTFLKLVLVKPGISKINGLRYSKKNSAKIIPKFIKKNNIDMSEYIEKDYTSFNDFFTRQIKPEKRPISEDKKALISCADSLLTVYRIDENLHFRVKGSLYSVFDLLKNNELAEKYNNGYCLIFRLTVRDYHHYCFIDDGTCDDEVKISGVLHTVNPIAGKKVKVYRENSREYTTLHTKNFGDVVQIEVGALMVGKIKNSNIHSFKKGEEKGYFEFGGSTVILLFEENKVIIDSDIMQYSNLLIETRVKYGEKIGRSS